MNGWRKCNLIARGLVFIGAHGDGCVGDLFVVIFLPERFQYYFTSESLLAKLCIFTCEFAYIEKYISGSELHGKVH